MTYQRLTSYTPGMITIDQTDQNQPATFQIRFLGEITPEREQWFREIKFPLIETEPGVSSTIEGSILDQSQLRGLLNKLWDLNLEIFLVKRMFNSQEEAHE